jgi:hypothetical protein
VRLRSGRAWSGRALSRAGLAVSLVIATLVRLPHLRFVPIWDGRTYWDACLQPALTGAFDPLAFNCFGHRSMLYMLAVSWPQYFSHGSALLLNLAHLAMSLVTIVGFHRAARALFRPSDASETGVEAALTTVVFASMPVWTAASLNLNPDSGILAGFLFALAFLLERRLVAATIAGVFLVLSKEIGLLLWLALAGLEVAFALAARDDLAPRAKRILRRWPLLLPPLAYWLTGIALRAHQMPAMWPIAARQAEDPNRPSLLRTFLTLDFFDPHFGAYVADIFLINFTWVMTLAIAAWLIALTVALSRRRALPLPARFDRRDGLFAALAGLAALYLLTRYPTFNNARYLLPAFPVVVLGFGVAASALIRRVELRASVFFVAALLQLASMSRTIDPVSRAAFGTFPFGEHELLAMTSRTQECCGYGRDQLVYNLQFAEFAYIQDKIFERLHPSATDVFAISRFANWYLQGPLDAKTFHRTLRTTNVIPLKTITLADIATGLPAPERLRYIAYPNVDNRADQRLFSIGYAVRGPLTIEDDGYAVNVFDLKRLHLVSRVEVATPAPPAR